MCFHWSDSTYCSRMELPLCSVSSLCSIASSVVNFPDWREGGRGRGRGRGNEREGERGRELEGGRGREGGREVAFLYIS